MAIDGSPPPPPLHTIFVDTSIDTHLAMAVSLHDTIRNVKAKIRAEHVLCFQEVGEIAIQAIKVKRRGFFYFLPDSMYVSNAFDGVKGGWFLSIDVVSLCHVKDQEVVSNKVTNAHDVAISPPEEGKNSCPDGRGHHDTMSTEIDNEHRPEMLIVQEKDKKRRKKTKNDLHDGEHRGGIKFSRSHNIDASKKSPEISCVGKEFCVTSLEGLQSKLNHKDAEVLQNPWIFEKPTKKRRRKSSKCHEEAHLAIPSETLPPRSPRENTLPHSSGKEAGISTFFGNIDETLPSDCRNVRAATDNVNLFNVANQKEIDALSMETYTVVIPSINKESDQILQVNPEDGRAKIVNSAQGTNSDELISQPNQISELMEANGQEYRSSTQLDSKVSSKLRRRMKKSKEESSRPLQSAEINGNQGSFNSDSSQVSLNDVQNVFVAAKSIKQADLKVDGGNCIGTMSEISSTAKKVPNQEIQDTVSQMNSDNPPNNIPSNFSEVSNLFVDHDLVTVIPSLPASEDQAKTRRRQKNSKSGRSGLESPEIHVPLPKSNCEITESNEGRGSDPSNLASVSNQKIEQHLVDAKKSVPLFEEDPPKLAEIPLMKSLDPCEEALVEALDGPEPIKEGNATAHTLSQGALEGPTISKSERNKSKKKVLNVQSSSKISERAGICRNDNTTFNFNNYFIPEQFRSQENDTASSGSRIANVRINKNTKHLSDQDSSLGIIEVDSSLQKADENHNIEKKLQNYVSQTLVQPSGDMETKQGEKIIDTMTSYDQRAQYNGCDPSTSAAVGLNNFDISQSQGATNHVSSSESTEDTPHHLRRFRVVKKIPIRRQKRMPNVSNPEILFLDASSRYPGDASGTCPDSHLREMQQRSVHL
ncbi:hypothetical protein KSP40_PGU020670 [Platanthera guangdongensis]|uniref:Uncharacterized protein n=1 Tax=Platanthera guangdongensis TaxID=2320717 RepID=A0ABR2MF15_9ASPA